MLRKSSIEELNLMKEELIKDIEEKQKIIKAIDTVLEIFEKDDPEEGEIKTARVETSKMSDEERKLRKKEYMKKYWARKKQEKINPDIEVEKGTDQSPAKKISKINYDDMG